jgi:hypothetical protein
MESKRIQLKLGKFLVVHCPNSMKFALTIILQRTWCVAKPSSDQATLLANINYACSHVDCQILQKGYPCFSPDSLRSHASIAMNLYYQCKGRNRWNCDFRDSGLIVKTDPSKDCYMYDAMRYPSGNNEDIFMSCLRQFCVNLQAIATASMRKPWSRK